jgi:hypothetical protein
VLRRLSPAFPSTDADKAVGKELGSIATAIATAYDRLDAIPDEMFPDTATETIERWEKVTRVSSFSADPIADRRQRVLNVLRRLSGPRLDQLSKALAGPLDLDELDITFVEVMRSFIDEALTVTDASTHAITGSPTTLHLGEPYPGTVDDFGVRLYVALSALGTPTVVVTSPEGTTWSPTITSTAGWYRDRTTFLGEIAGGDWKVTVTNGSAVNMTDCRLLVSNNVDSGQIYNLFAYADPNLTAEPDLVEAQRILHRTALGHLRAFVIQSLAFTVGDEFSLVGRDPVGV